MLPILFATLGLTLSAFSADLAGCQPQLEKSMCYTQPVEHWALDSQNMSKNLKRFQERVCSPLPSAIKKTLITVYQQYPREIQQAFCEIKKVFIVTGDVSYGAMAEYYFDPATVKVSPGIAGPRFTGKPTGYILEISEKNRFKGESGSAYLTRVLQARFGNASQKDQLPVAEYTNPFASNGALATTIVHEIGHMLARAHKVSSTYFLPLSESPWSKLSFKLEADSYYLKHAVPGYADSMGFKMLSVQDVKPTLELFRKTGIATLYGGTSPQEDFAEFFMLNTYENLKWIIKGRVVLDLPTEMKTNPSFKNKKAFIRKLMLLPEPFSLKSRGIVSGEIGPM